MAAHDPAKPWCLHQWRFTQGVSEAGLVDIKSCIKCQSITVVKVVGK